MKKRNVTKKLDMKKTTISNLDKTELSIPRGGVQDTQPRFTCVDWTDTNP
ncbi:MAG: hypothetical protein GY765_38810 [bacterium]|nr:hypothetical protein [bacterium]